jgi:cellulose synthase/poly-beta-1,6-N-acetylglucosamine synthase-like glycosyltransferase
MSLLVALLLTGLAVPAMLCCLYLLALTLLSRAPGQPRRSSRQLRFDVLIPAHDEATQIGAVVRDLHNLDWPADRYRILVVADNCTDDTAAQARAAGAWVLERNVPELRGKGHALVMGFQASAEQRWAHAVVVVDADTAASPNLLEAFAARMDRSDRVMQAHYDVLNTQASWRTRLLAIALASFHTVRSRARERLGLSCGLRGNGWCITHELLRRVPYAAHSLTEDIEYGITLGMAGHRILYVDEARVSAQMVSGEAASRSQRQRWEAGRIDLLRSQLWPLLRATRGSGAWLRLDLAIDLLVPPLSYVALNVLLLGAVAGLALLTALASAVWLWIATACALCLCLYVLRGWQLSGLGGRGLAALAYAPFFVVWKLLLMLRLPATQAWIRTRREPP